LWVFFLKLGVAPFHFWLIDVYESLSFPLLFLFSVLPKIAYFFLLINFLSYFFFLNFNFFFQFFVFLSVLIGTIGGLFQNKLNRLFAYSSVLNNGFFLLLFLVLDYEYFSSLFLLYYVNYCILTFLVFGVFIFYQFLASNSYHFFNISHLSVIFHNFPLMLVLLGALFSLASVPPFAGFWVKFFILLYSFSHLSYFNIIILLLLSFFSSIFYLRLVKALVFEPSFFSLFRLSAISEVFPIGIYKESITFFSFQTSLFSFLPFTSASFYLYILYFFSFFNLFFFFF